MGTPEERAAGAGLYNGEDNAKSFPAENLTTQSKKFAWIPLHGSDACSGRFPFVPAVHQCRTNVGRRQMRQILERYTGENVVNLSQTLT
jgi:hypothetical protein